MKVLITAGPTREDIDPVRFISNRSSGRMGCALAEAALKAGHKVALVSGPVSIAAPRGAKLVKIESAAEMAREVRRLAKFADVVIMAAAVADYTPVKIAARKIKKTGETLLLKLRRTEDILASLGKHKRKNQVLVGFAAETDALIKNAKRKLAEKNLDWIVANKVGRPESGFESEMNAATMISRGGRTVKFPLQSKKKLAKDIFGILSGNIS